MIPEQVEGISEVTFDELQMREREKREELGSSCVVQVTLQRRNNSERIMIHLTEEMKRVKEIRRWSVI